RLPAHRPGRARHQADRHAARRLRRRHAAGRRDVPPGRRSGGDGRPDPPPARGAGQDPAADLDQSVRPDGRTDPRRAVGRLGSGAVHRLVAGGDGSARPGLDDRPGRLGPGGRADRHPVRRGDAAPAGPAGRSGAVRAGDDGPSGRGDTAAHPRRDQRAALPLRHAEGAGTMTTVLANPGLAEPGDAVLRPHAEQEHQAELEALAGADDRPRPPGWRMSPWAVTVYLLGGTAPDGTVITPKYVGSRRLIEVAVATLATDRALLLLGPPGTAKTWLSEHLSAAISGDSTLLVQGTAGTAEDAVRYGWNYARLIAEGPSTDALVASPVMTAMRGGKVVRIEEMTRMPAEVQDALITVLSEKTLPVPELGFEVQAVPGFTLIATANDRDRGVNEMSSALKRRFNTVVLPLPESAEEEVEIVSRRVAELGGPLQLPAEPPSL